MPLPGGDCDRQLYGKAMTERSDRPTLDELARKLADAVPGNIKSVGEDMERNFKSLLQSALARMDLVTREEFDVQMAVLARSRENSRLWRPGWLHWRRTGPAETALGRGPLNVGLARILSRGQMGMDAYQTIVEVHVAGGLPAFTISGLPRPPCGRAATASAPHCRPVATACLRAGSRCTWDRRTSPRRAADSTCRSPWGSCR